MPLKHGEYKITVDNNIVTICLKGSFNKQAVTCCTTEIKRIVEDNYPNKFCILFDNSEYTGCTPDGFETLEAFNQWLGDKNLVAKAMVINSSMHLDIIDKRTPSRQNQKIKNFNCLAEAQNWLQQQLTLK